MEQTLEGGELATQISGRRAGETAVHGPEVAVCWAFSGNSKEARVAGAEWATWRVVSDKSEMHPGCIV